VDDIKKGIAVDLAGSDDAQVVGHLFTAPAGQKAEFQRPRPARAKDLTQLGDRQPRFNCVLSGDKPAIQPVVGEVVEE